MKLKYIKLSLSFPFFSVSAPEATQKPEEVSPSRSFSEPTAKDMERHRKFLEVNPGKSNWFDFGR